MSPPTATLCRYQRWSIELPASYREWLPHIADHRDGRRFVRADSLSGRQISNDARAMAKTVWTNCCSEAEPSFTAAELVADLARDGIHGAVLITTDSAAGLRPDAPLEVEVAYCQLVNDWLAEQWRPYLDRFAPGILLPWHDIPATVQELERAAGLGLRPALLPDVVWDRPYFLPEWEPVWELCDALKIPITMHVGGERVPAKVKAVERTRKYPGRHIVSFYRRSVDMGETLAWFVNAGIFARYPDLHVVMTEGESSWLAFAMQFFDHYTVDGSSDPLTGRDSAVHRRAAVNNAKLEAPPSYYLKRQAHTTFMWDPLALRLRDVIGLDCLMFGNDYPHLEGSFPFSAEWIDKQFAGVPEHEIDQIVRGNASRIFHLSV